MIYRWKKDENKTYLLRGLILESRATYLSN
jgi:hypothetical protein